MGPGPVGGEGHEAGCLPGSRDWWGALAKVLINQSDSYLTFQASRPQALFHLPEFNPVRPCGPVPGSTCLQAGVCVTLSSSEEAASWYVKCLLHTTLS